MADEVKPTIFVWYCKGCAHPVEVPIPDYIKRVEKLRCECGKTEEERIAKWVSMAAIALFLSLFGSCVASHHYSTEQVKAVAEKHEIYKNGVAPFMQPDYDVKQKVEQPTPTDVKPPIDPRATPHPAGGDKK
jgi:hypothetical protein